MDENHLEYLSQLLPKYLTPEQSESLFKSLKDDFPRSNDPNLLYRKLEDKSTFYQGDGIIDIPFANFNSEQNSFELEYFPASILSNTCDIASENTRLIEPYITLAAIYNLNEVLEFLKDDGVKKPKIESFVNDLRNNSLTSFFYLPEIRNGEFTVLPESFIRFDQTTSLDANLVNSDTYDKEYCQENNDGDRLFTFSNYGFYLFIFKLSVHFCRFKEGVFRY